MKKILLTALCAALLVSCGATRSATVDSAIAEAETLHNLAKDRGAEIPANTVELIASAKKQYKDSEIEAALRLADEATLQLQLSLLKQENKSMADSLAIANGSLTIIRKLHAEHQNVNRK